MYSAEVRVSLKKGVADPEGSNTKKALELLGFKGVRDVRSVKVFSIALDAPDEDSARRQAEEACRRLLVNPVIHHFEITIKAEG